MICRVEKVYAEVLLINSSGASNLAAAVKT